MPVDFLTHEQQKSYGRYAGEPTAAQLTRYFHLDETDHELVNQRRGEHDKLGFALQLSTLRFLGTFLANPLAVPDGAIAYLCAQLGIDPVCLPSYLHRRDTRMEHAAEIKARLGYRDFEDQPEHWRLLRWLYERAWFTAERPSVLFDMATARLVERKILLPGVTTLARIVASIRDCASNRLWKILANLPSRAQLENLEKLLVVEEGTRQSTLDRLRKGPTRFSGPALAAAISRLIEIRNLGAGNVDLCRVPTGRIKALARLASGVRAQAISRMPYERRVATLLSFAHVLEETAQDDVLDVLDLLIADLLRDSTNTGKKDRLSTLKKMDRAALRLCKACEVLLDPDLNDADIRFAVFAAVSESELEEALSKVLAIARPPDDNYYQELMNRWLTVRRFLPPLLGAIDFQATQRLQDCLRRRDMFVSPSARWTDPRAKLLKEEAWHSAKSQVCRTLNLKPAPNEELDVLRRDLHEAYLKVSANFSGNTAVRIEKQDGKDVLVLSPLDALDESESLIELREETSALLPEVDLSDVLLELSAKTGFAQEFTHLSEADSRVDDLNVSVCALLVAEACNIGLEPVSTPKSPALTRDRLSYLKQNYFRSDTITRANARLVEAQSKISLAQKWGGGEVASADGICFVVPLKTINAGPNPKYFGIGRGVTYYNFSSNQLTGFHGIVIPGTVRDSLWVLDGLLEQQTCLQPTEIMTDTAGYTDVVFGLFWLLGYQFSSRLADIGDARFWRIDANANYGCLDGLARNRINTSLIEKNWDDLLRVAGSLKSGTVSASESMRTLQASSRPSALAKAIAELGRISKTLYLLAYIDDESYRRRILLQLNRQEGRHSVTRVTFHGQRGELRQRYREGQEDQLGTLGLVVNAIVLWNTMYLERALEHLEAQGIRVEPEDVASLSPLQHSHINMQGRHQFVLPEALKQGEYRALRLPDQPDMPIHLMRAKP